jgi:hypothetical protein
MKSIRNAILSATIVCASLATSAQTTESDHLFQYPTVPDNIETFTERANFYIENFWQRCNLKSAFSAKQKLQEAFKDYVTFMPYADAEVVHKSIDKLITDVSKTPKNLLTLANMAEATLYSDSAAIISEECYLPFIEAVANSKKLSKAEKSRYAYQAKAIGGSQVGMKAPDFTYTRPDGTTGKLSDSVGGKYVLIFFNDPECDQCELTRVRLAADYNLNDLINDNLIDVMSIYPGEATDEWIAKTDTYNKKWIVGASPDIDELYSMFRPPVIYYLNGQHKILSKTFTIDNLLDAFRVVRNKMKSEQEATANQE